MVENISFLDNTSIYGIDCPQKEKTKPQRINPLNRIMSLILTLIALPFALIGAGILIMATKHYEPTTTTDKISNWLATKTETLLFSYVDRVGEVIGQAASS